MLLSFRNGTGLPGSGPVHQDIPVSFAAQISETAPEDTPIGHVEELIHGRRWKTSTHMAHLLGGANDPPFVNSDSLDDVVS
jgi:hypothetical protein